MTIDSIFYLNKFRLGFYTSLLLSGLFAHAAMAQTKQSQTFTLMGEVLPSVTGTVYLLKQNDVAIDSTRIRQGQFTFKGALEDPGLYWIRINTDDLSYPVFLEASPIRMKLKDKGTAQVSGSKLHDQWESYNSGFIDPIREQLITLFEQRKAATQKGDTVLFNRLMKQNDSVSISYGTRYRKIIEQKPYTFFNLHLLQESGMDDAYVVNMLNEFRPQLATYRTFQALEQEMAKRAAGREKTAIGVDAPLFVLPTSKGGTSSLDSVRKSNKLVLLDFWASWCGPCIKELPSLKALYNQYAKEGLEVISVSLDKDPAQWQQAIRRHSPPGLQLLATDQSQIMEKYAVIGIPHTFLIDQSGKIQGDNLHGEELTKKVAELLGEKR
ncbi:TlpA disulfide reductase family protein [Spirosoma sp. KUDC1026]|uniref:TlpA disulfide reductase family protein n=1 Tax=Spirosoma sp. KUDC1026 TaxID=2745947 RepID=UPI00159BB7D9|nr:TlpA disulfide reductase family protein [Spirosoma sp. KUDC1026]QKZ15083.1 AhpC/TSA family protein [Spirosoma sp. KUDC1026]